MDKCLKRMKTYFVTFLPKYCFFNAIANACLNTHSNMSLVYRKAIDLYIDLFILRRCYTCTLYQGGFRVMGVVWRFYIDNTVIGE